MPTLRRDMSVGLRGDVVGRDDFDEDFFEFVLREFVAELGEGAFDKEFAGLDDTDGVAEPFDFAHDVRGEDDGFAVVAAFADESSDGAGSHDVEAVGGLVENHDGWIVDEGAGDGGFLHHPGGELVAAAVAETIHVQAAENVVDAFFQGGFVEAIEAAEVFNKFLGGEPAIESGGGGEEADVGADFLGLLDDVVAADDGGAVGGLEDSSEHAERGGFAGAVGSEKTVNLSGLAGKADVIYGADFAALLVLEALGQATSFNHRRTPRWLCKDRAKSVHSLLRKGQENVTGRRTGNQPLWQLGHCLASNRSGVTRNMLLHWMQTRWMTGLTTAPGWSGLWASAGWGVPVFSDVCSADMAGF